MCFPTKIGLSCPARTTPDGNEDRRGCAIILIQGADVISYHFVNSVDVTESS